MHFSFQLKAISSAFNTYSDIFQKHSYSLLHSCQGESCSVVSDSATLVDYTVHGILQARILERVAFPFSRISSQPRFPTLQADSLPADLQGKLRNTGVGSLTLLEWIFPTQESNQGLLHCRRILYPLSYQGSPLLSKLPLKLNVQLHL